MTTVDDKADLPKTPTPGVRAGRPALAAAKRVLWALAVLFGVSVLVFVMMRVLPGDMVDVMYGDAPLSNADRQAIRRQLGYDKPLPEQYVEWVGRSIRLQFGNSLWTRRTVTQELGDRVPITLELLGLATILQAIL